VLLSNPALIITDGGQQAEKGSMKHLVSVNNRFGPSNRPEQVAILSSMAVTIFVSVWCSHLAGEGTLCGALAKCPLILGGHLLGVSRYAGGVSW